ncbi:ABC transporter substrate-binding protein [Microbacterium sp. SORGH_AS_0862]|uniref:ABC transporter substrate-binding protein n=1 Tax=Microbacterium sp. SORGH_AS_0862 TaxID=3041789 RepID=UPI00279381BB|nr:ABC transporter substrate-binding protein [Microbacterium sp. SORGH_AS_0862]MDQ1205336.1 peptide/nickel transport system substrate-binding protein [Microbacterium sp. SORGH_AS_0862]
MPAIPSALRRTPRRTVALTVAVIGVIALAGCAAGGTGGAEVPQVLTYLDAEVPTSAQVQESGTWQTRALQQNVTDRLISRNPETNELEPWIAESWEQSADGLDYTFVIRDGVTYSDGTPLDVNSVKKNLEWQSAGDPDNGVSANGQFPADITVTVDEAAREVHVHLAEPYAPLLNVLSSWSAGLVADATIDAPYEEQTQFINLIGSGPFVVTSETYAQEIVLTRRDGYAWAPQSSENQGEAYLETLTWIPVEEDSVRLGTLTSGEAGAIRYVEPSEEASLSAQGYHVQSKTGVGLSNQWFLRPTTVPLDDLAVRRAVSHAIDREAILEAIYTDNWSAATSPLAPGTDGYVDESAKFAYDPVQAADLLDEAGWTRKDADGYRTKDGERLHLKTYVDVYDNTAKSLFQHVQAQLKDAGIELELDELDYSSYWGTAFADPEVGFLRVGWPHPDSGVGLAEYYSADGSDLLGLDGSDSTLEELLQQQYTLVSPADREAALGRIQDYLIDNAYVLPILNDSQVIVTRPEVEGFAFTDGALPSFYNVKITS